ncbi:DUF5709 domain-containing protein [Streptomyces odontomachi]|uniref:DUF5709 domain-containing protein n=1 Tax=Streptomyces odontomachi TaxID=2944940 RepID=UPI00210E7B2B|nr:DUF5709 domain-containing protein [Streptomyces sp. ODS25]
MRTEEPRGDEVYQPDAPDDSEVPEYEGIRESEDTLIDRGADPYDEGASPPERPLAVEKDGTTPLEQSTGESLDRRLAQEEPDTAAWASGNGIGDLPGGEGEPRDDEVGEGRAGRLVAPDEGAHEDEEKALVADDVGIAGAAASAEEAAVHVVPGIEEEIPETPEATEVSETSKPPGTSDTPENP